MTVGIGALEGPMWFALPPEVHSTLLSTGAGPGPLLAAASAWRMLAAEYLAVETELTEILAAAQGAAWTGPTADRFAAAHQPFLLWLRQAAAVATVAATGHETTAAGYMSALGGMPTLAELAANHAVHGVLLATNFFGINTIPIAATEADYTRMWVQAATTMSAYGGVAEASLTSTPVTSPAPPIVSPAANAAADSSFPDPTKVIIQLLQNWLTRIGDLASQYLPGPLGSFVSQMLNSLVAFMSTQLFLIPAYSVLDTAIYFGPFLALLAPFAAIGLLGLIGLEGLDDSPVGESHSAMPGRQAQTFPISTGVTPAGNGAAASGTTAGTPTSSAATAGASAPAAGATHGFYAISGDPDGEGFSPTCTTKTAAAATAALAAPAAASLAARDQIRAKRRAQARQHGRKYEFAFVDDEADTATSTDPPDAEQTTASENGSGALGFAGTVPKTAAAQAQGLTRVSSAGLDEAAQEPMLPRTWEP